MKKIVTHLNPDLDAIAGVWLIKKYLPGWKEAKVEFVKPGKATEKNPQADTDPDVLWIDVGRGKLDHHQTGQYLSAAKRCFDYIRAQRKNHPLKQLDEKALKRLVEVITQIDNGKDIQWPEAGQDRHRFYLYNVIEGLGNIGETDEKIVAFGLQAMEAVLHNFKLKIKAEERLAQGIEFQTSWGKAIAVDSCSKDILWHGQEQGYVLAVGKDQNSGAVRMYARSDSKVNLTKASEEIKKLDPKSDWFLHATKRLLLNQAAVNPNMRPTKLSLKQVIKILQKK